MSISEAKSCYVYIQLPGTLEVLTCAKYILEPTEYAVTRGRFKYARTYLENPRAVDLDKFELPLSSTIFETFRLRGIFGALRDASPDYWGRRVIEMQIGFSHLSEIEYLLNSPEDRAGALSFGLKIEPPAPVRRFNHVLQLSLLLQEAERIAQGEDPSTITPSAKQLEDLIQLGTSLGGARPKNVVEDEEGLWVAKFPAQGDRWSNAPVEAAMLNLARECGIRAAQPRPLTVAGQPVLLVKRFDREKTEEGYLRHRMVSALTVLGSDDALSERTNWSYLRLADEIKRWAKDPDGDLEELFRRIVFNTLISNLDDHPRNHALIAPGAHWMLSPAYDLTPTPSISMERRDLAMDIGSFGRYANRENLLSQCPRFRLTREEAGAIIDRMKLIVESRWREFVLKEGGTERDCKAIQYAFAYPGFEYEPHGLSVP